MTVFFGLFVIVLAIVLGLFVGQRRGLLNGIGVSLGVLFIGIVAYVGLITLLLPM